jgi:hypothetical protein
VTGEESRRIDEKVAKTNAKSVRGELDAQQRMPISLFGSIVFV